MKNIVKIISASLFLGLSANACPNLTGTFTCKADGAPSDITLQISQTETDGVTTYSVDASMGDQSNHMDVPADGVTRTSTTKNESGTYYQEDTYSCVGDEALTDLFVARQTDSDGNLVQEAKGSDRLSISAAGDFVEETTTTDGQGQTQTNTTTCTRQ